MDSPVYKDFFGGFIICRSLLKPLLREKTMMAGKEKIVKNIMPHASHRSLLLSVCQM
jgi:hypothetical protein